MNKPSTLLPLKYLFGLLVMLLMAACGQRSGQHELALAESIMQERPDSALTVLEAISPDSLSSEEDKALYALLLTQARDKNYYMETDDSLISTAVDYYSRCGNKKREQLARYYKSVILMQKGDINSSVPDALKSLDLAREQKNAFEIGRCHQQIADIYHQTYNLPQAVAHRDSAYRNFERAGKDNFALYALIELTGEAIDMKDLAKGEEKLQVISEICPANDSIALALMHANFVRLYKMKNEYRKALNHFYIQQKYLGDKFSEYQAYSQIADIYLSLNNIDSAVHYLEFDKHINTDFENSMAYHSVIYKLSKQTGEYKIAMHALEKMHYLGDNNVNMLINNNAALAEKDYYNQKALDEQYRSFIFKSICIIIAIIAFAIIIIIQIKHRYRLKNQKLESERKIYQIKQFVDEQQEIIKNQNLENEININQIKQFVNKQQDIIKKLFSERFTEIDALCAKYFKYIETDKPVNNIVKDVEKQFMAIKDDECFESLQNYVNCVDNDILTKFKTELPNLKDNDYRFIAYKLAGFSPRSICLIMDISIQNYYTKCTRLRDKVEKSDSINKGAFLNALKN